jgi:radical SAM-linked protein
MREQRLVFLGKLGAEEPRPAAPLPRRGAQAKRPPVRERQGDPLRYRFIYEKLGAAAFLSHLDIIRALPRAFRRLELPLYYSLGFHPKPDMAFGPALALGVASLCEAVDVKIAADVDVAALLDELSAGTQPGLRFVRGAALRKNDASITRVIDVARYAVGIPRSAIEPRGGDTWLRGRIERSLAAQELTVVRRIDGIGKRVEVRGFLRSIEVDRDAQWGLERAGIVGDLVPIAVEVDIRGSGGVKIAEVIEAVFDDAELPQRAVRVALGARQADGSIAAPI